MYSKIKKLEEIVTTLIRTKALQESNNNNAQ
jgi:hypothetical protein